jgi:hypothetical protein
VAVSHENRIHSAVNTFEEANARMVRLLEALSDEAASRAPAEGGWNPAQVGYHVATTNQLFAGILSGAVPLAKPAPSGFAENTQVFVSVPARIKTLPPLEPPASADRAEAIARLQAAQSALVTAIKALPANRATGEVMDLPFGTVTMYQAAEFTGAHVQRHIEQIHRCAAGA